MSRRRVSQVRNIAGDPRYEDVVVAKFINLLMKGGKKSVARGILYGSLDDIKIAGSEDKDGSEILKEAIENVKPVLEVRSRRVGGSTYQVPTEVRATRRQSLSIRWIINSATQRSGKSMREKLRREIEDAYHSRGGAFRKKEDVHRMAEANRAFSHFSF